MANNLFIDFLPPWIETGIQPAFYDKESGTVLQQTARMYAKVNEVVQSVNNQNETIDDYINQFNELHDYVYDYFDNLDVQEEINNKIDDMVNNGTFQSVFDNYVGPKIDALDTRLSSLITNETTARTTTDASLQSQINALSSGSPIPVSSISAMTNTSKVYLNTTDGKWYYYDGDSWEIGGTYQSTGIASDSIDLTMLDDSVFKNAIYSTNPASLGGIDADGSIVESNTRIYTDITNLTTCDTIYIKINDPNLVPVYFVLYSGDHFIGRFSQLGSHLITPLGNGAYMLTRGDYTKMRVSWKKSNNATFTDDEVSALYLSIYQTTQYQEKDNYIASLDKVGFEHGGVGTNNGSLLTRNDYARTLTIKIDKSVGYRYFKINGTTDGMRFGNVVTYLDGTYVAGYNRINNGVPVWFSKDHVKIYNDGSFNELRIVIGKYDEEESFTDEEVANLSVSCIERFTIQSKWAGKKYVALGDSITYGFIPRNYTGYPGQLKSYATLTASTLGMSFVNAGISGNTVALKAGGDTPMCERYTELDNDADLITVMGGTNDIRQGIPLGTMSDRTEDTFYGALHILLGGLYQKYFINQGTTTGKNKHIVVLTPPKLLRTSGGTAGGTGTLYDLEPWCNAIKEVANYYSLPVLDMYNLSNMNPHLNQTVHGTETGYTGYYNPYMTDGTHPTQEGAYIMSKVLEGYLETII